MLLVPRAKHFAVSFRNPTLILIASPQKVKKYSILKLYLRLVAQVKERLEKRYTYLQYVMVICQIIVKLLDNKAK